MENKARRMHFQPALGAANSEVTVCRDSQSLYAEDEPGTLGIEG
ncbi:hypothetical protein EGR_01533 [Echinococcus granulosus]|uniref:Uncharacterized protein n=1 Tax=Echinococcus granulosus TaxID=6210 RepID=W6US32_ECHGR|nr:hypothetical protein EGR_01533 [Echinococcus granulosus]EUB63451.1 hypothetical protein EGR_01533 [Echinococcus granulosus]